MPLDPSRPVAVVQARMGSTRLGGKVLLPAAGKPLLEHLFDRLAMSRELAGAVLATTTDPRDDVLALFAETRGIPHVRGSEQDVLSRYALAMRTYDLRIVVRVTSDCPLIDPGILDHVVRTYLDRADQLDYVSNMHPPTYPDGLDVEVIPRASLERADREATQPHEREHVTPYIWDNPGRFRIGNVSQPEEMHLTHRWTLDYPEDYELLRAIIERLYVPGRVFGMRDVLDLLEKEPDLFRLNSRYVGTNWWGKAWDKLKTTDTLRARREP